MRNSSKSTRLWPERPVARMDQTPTAADTHKSQAILFSGLGAQLAPHWQLVRNFYWGTELDSSEPPGGTASSQSRPAINQQILKHLIDINDLRCLAARTPRWTRKTWAATRPPPKLTLRRWASHSHSSPVEFYSERQHDATSTTECCRREWDTI